MIQTCEEYLKKTSGEINVSELISILDNILKFIDIVCEKEKKIKFMIYLYKISSLPCFKLLPEQCKFKSITKAKQLLYECNQILYNNKDEIYLDFKEILENFLEKSKKIL